MLNVEKAETAKAFCISFHFMSEFKYWHECILMAILFWESCSQLVLTRNNTFQFYFSERGGREVDYMAASQLSERFSGSQFNLITNANHSENLTLIPK